MKAVCLVGMTSGVYGRTGGIVSAVNNTLSELGLSIAQINLPEYCLPYYEAGSAVENFLKIAAVIRDAKNIIIAYNVTQSQPSAALKVFLEYLEGNENAGLFEDKNILNIAISFGEGERVAAGYVSGIMEGLGAYEITRICIGGETLERISNGSFPMNAIEKYAEDYYRLIRQNRVFLRSSDYKGGAYASDRLNSLRNQAEASLNNTRQTPAWEHQNFGNMGKAPEAMHEATQGAGLLADYDNAPANVKGPGIDFDAFNSRQQDDIEELTKLFATKLKTDNSNPQHSAGANEDRLPGYDKPYSKSINNMNLIPAQQLKNGTEPVNRQNEHRPFIVNELVPGQNTRQGPGMPAQAVQPAMTGALHPHKAYGEAAPVVPRNKTCKQMTQSLPHYFQSQLAQDTEAVFQFLISGDEDFSGYLIIKNKENEYYNGQHSAPDITIISSANVWQDVLRGKFTAQKAFMTGQLKVRGNFMLLNRFDQLYKIL